MRSRTWFLLSGLFLTAAILFWRMGDEEIAGRGLQNKGNPTPAQAVATNLSLLSPGANGATPPAMAGAIPSFTDSRVPTRLRNTTEPLGALEQSSHAILLANGLFDTRKPGVILPEAFRSAGAPGAYVVQSRSVVDRAFRKTIESAGGRIISYIPNNAFLVQADESLVTRLGANSRVQAILPYEPYYKVDAPLLAASQAGNASGPATLGVTLFPAGAASFDRAVAALGGEVLLASQTPFGPQYVVTLDASQLAPLARLTEVQYVEAHVRRTPANDRTRVFLGVATNSTVTTNYLELTGEGVLVNVNDTGIDQAHPDLVGRVTSDDTNSFTLVDDDGHGTHVAGTIGGSGLQSPSVLITPDGSVTSADFRGMAPKAGFYALPIDLQTGPLVSDAYLQARAAQAKARVSNNSWGYPSQRTYTTSAASYDAAVRDALPDVPGEQPMIYIFAAGNSGEGEDNGLSGVPGSITAPATAKNVITVGSVETLRNLTNYITTNIVTLEGETRITNTLTNFFFLAETDSNDEISSFSSRGNVGIGIEGESGRFKPDVVAPGSFILSLRSAGFEDIDVDLPVIDALRTVNTPLKPHYRYESGTSMAAPAISGLMALMEEYFTKRLRLTNSPALMKALLINGSRSVNSRYSLQTRSLINYQGWGAPNMPTILPVAMAETDAPEKWPLRFFDQGPTNTVSTGQSSTWKFNLSEEAQQTGLRVTLVWTDPPGNPAAGIKLVNDLDLVVTNLDSGIVYYGNDIPEGSDFNEPKSPEAVPNRDVVNNVETVFIRGPLGTNISVTVTGRRVNVNAVTANTNVIAQDFALVVSSSDPALTNTFTKVEHVSELVLPRLVTPVTNGLVLMNQKVGGNFPLTNSANGDISQWAFYVFTNTAGSTTIGAITNGTNVAFVTFLPPNLSRPRAVDADIDMYVSPNPAITNLDAAALASASKSTQRGGTQVIFFTNAPLDSVFYVAVKSEDQQGGEFALVGLSSDKPFDELDLNGNLIVHGLPAFIPIPDGTADQPGAGFMFGIATRSVPVGRVVVTNHVFHESFGDLIGNLSHNDRFVVLNNKSSVPFGVTNIFRVYDDRGLGPYFDLNGNLVTPTDGPGHLSTFMGEPSSGLWVLSMVDNSPTHVGTIVSMDIFLENGSLSDGELQGSLLGNEAGYYYVDVPPDATNLVVRVSGSTGPLDVYIRRGQVPTFTDYDKRGSVEAPGGTVSISTRDVPPLVGGRYFIMVFNPSATTVNFRIGVEVQRNLAIDTDLGFKSTDTPKALADDAITRSSISVPINRDIIDVQVGVRIDHPRIADLVLHLNSPQGTRVMLQENRGGLSPAGMGTGTGSNVTYFGFTESTNRSRTPVKFMPPPFTANLASTQYFVSGFEGVLPGAFSAGQDFDGWTVLEVGSATNKTTGTVTSTPPAVVASVLSLEGTQFLDLGTGRIRRTIPTEAGKTYSLGFSYWGSTNGDINAHVVLNGLRERLIAPRPATWASYRKQFTATANSVTLEINSDRFTPGLFLDGFFLAETATLWANPEENLRVLQGESAAGGWTLEVWDNRAGATVPAPSLLSWEIQFLLAPPRVAARPVTSGIPLSGTVTRGEIQYFIVDVPRAASFATNRLASAGDVMLLYSSSGLPTGQFPDDLIVDRFGTNGVESLLLSTNRPPQLVPGQRYYLGVANYDTSDTNSFVLQVDFDRVDSVIPGLITLTNGIAFTNTIPATNALDYYQFVVSPIATNLEVRVTPIDGNVDLMISKAIAVPDPLPRLGINDYSSTAPGTDPEIVTIDETSFPVPVGGGPWYFGVSNQERRAVRYAIVVREITPPVTTMTNGVLVAGAIAPSNSVAYFQFDVSPGATEAVFETSAADGDVDLLARRGAPLPDLLTYQFISTNSGTAGEIITVLTNSTPTALSPGRWYLTVTNKENRDVTFSILARETVPGGGVEVPILSSEILGSDFCISWVSVAGRSYRIEGRVGLDDPGWTVVAGPIVATGTSTSGCVPLTRPERFFRVVEVQTGPPVGTPVTLDVVALSSGGVRLSWTAAANQRFQVESSAKVDSGWTALGGPITSATGTYTFTDDGSLTGGLGATRFYRVRQVP